MCSFKMWRRLMNKRENEKLRKIQLIEQSALDLFVTRGYSATKISDIAQKADVSVGLVMKYFHSKEFLYEHLIEKGVQSINFSLEIPHTNMLELFEKITRYIFSQLDTNPVVAKMFMLLSEARKNDHVSEKVKALLEAITIIEDCCEWIVTGQDEGSIREGNPHTLSYTYWCCIQGMAEAKVIFADFKLPEVSWILAILRREENNG